MTKNIYSSPSSQEWNASYFMCVDFCIWFVECVIVLPCQVDNSGLRKQADFAETVRKDEEESSYSAEKIRKLIEIESSIPGRNASRFF